MGALHLQVQGIAREFATPAGRYVAVKSFNLDIARGEFVTLIGH